MKKLRMALDDLRVDSFETGAAAARLGTVHAHATTRDTNPVPTPKTVGFECHGLTHGWTECGNHTCQPTCAVIPTDCYSFESCPGTCPMQGTCHYTCGTKCVIVHDPTAGKPF